MALTLSPFSNVSYLDLMVLFLCFLSLFRMALANILQADGGPYQRRPPIALKVVASTERLRVTQWAIVEVNRPLCHTGLFYSCSTRVCFVANGLLTLAILNLCSKRGLYV